MRPAVAAALWALLVACHAPAPPTDPPGEGGGEPPFRVVQAGEADLRPRGEPRLWSGFETYEEWLGEDPTCDVRYATEGEGTSACPFCAFSFDVRYAVLEDRSGADCAYRYAPSDGEVLALGYYRYGDGGPGLLVYSPDGVGWLYWGTARLRPGGIEYAYDSDE